MRTTCVEQQATHSLGMLFNTGSGAFFSKCLKSKALLLPFPITSSEAVVVIDALKAGILLFYLENRSIFASLCVK